MDWLKEGIFPNSVNLLHRGHFERISDKGIDESVMRINSQTTKRTAPRKANLMRMKSY